MVSFPIVDLTDTDIDSVLVSRLASALGLIGGSPDPNEVIRTATDRLAAAWHTAPDEDDIVPGGVAVDLPYGSLILRCDSLGTPLDMTLVRVGDPGYTVRMGADDTWYRVLSRPAQLGEAISGARARRLPTGSIVVPAAPDADGAETVDPDALVAQRQSNGTWHPATPAGSRYIVLHLGSR